MCTNSRTALDTFEEQISGNPFLTTKKKTINRRQTMTTNITPIEQEFFEAFGIEKKEYKTCDAAETSPFCPFDDADCDNCGLHVTYKTDYPSITPEIVLGLIKIIIHKGLEFGLSYSELHNTYFASKDDGNNSYLSCQEYSLKDAILSLCINLKHELQSEVKELFNEQ